MKGMGNEKEKRKGHGSWMSKRSGKEALQPDE